MVPSSDPTADRNPADTLARVRARRQGAHAPTQPAGLKQAVAELSKNAEGLLFMRTNYLTRSSSVGYDSKFSYREKDTQSDQSTLLRQHPQIRGSIHSLPLGKGEGSAPEEDALVAGRPGAA